MFREEARLPMGGPIAVMLTRSLLFLLSTVALVAAAASHGMAEPSQHAGASRLLRLAMTIEENKQTPPAAESAARRDADQHLVTTVSFPAPKQELSAGAIRARLKLPGAGMQFSDGTPAFAEITLTNETSAKPVDAEILLETEIAEISFISGKRVGSTDTDGGKFATIKGLRKGKARKIFVELVLRGAARDENQTAQAANTLRITLRTASSDGNVSDSTVVAWPVADCAGAFYSQIVSIREQNSARIGPALKAAWRRDRQRPGRWLFKPPVSGSASKRVCARWRRYWDPRRGRYRARCTRYRTVRRGGAAGVKVTKEERRLINFAAKWVRTRAIDPQLSTKQNFGWVSQKVAIDLRGYLKQDKHPAICTGVSEFVGYYTKRMADFRKRSELFSAHLAKARTLAFAKAAEAREAVKADPGGHPGWGAVPLSISTPESGRTLESLIAGLVELGGGDAPGEEIRQAPSTFAALKSARKYVSDDGLSGLAKMARNSILHALSLIETADYIAAVAHHYSELDATIIGSLEAVQKAHGKHCTCAQ